MTDKVLWGGQEFTVYEPDTNWKDVPGVYIFAGPRDTVADRFWYPLYVGQTESLKQGTYIRF